MARPLPELQPHWQDVLPEVRPTPSLNRCVVCGSRTERRACSPRCAVALAEMEIAFAIGAPTVEDAEREAAEHVVEAEAWRVGRPFGRGN